MFAADFSRVTLKSAAKSKEELVNQKYAIMFLFQMLFTTLYILNMWKWSEISPLCSFMIPLDEPNSKRNRSAAGSRYVCSHYL